MTDKPVQRYDIDIKVNIYIQDGELTAPPTVSNTAVPLPDGHWCKSSDVAALEAENARLRRVEKAADKMRAAIREGGSDTRLRETGRAYDAAKSGAGEGVGNG